MAQPTEILHVVERIDDQYGGPAKSIPYTAWSASTEHLRHRIYAGRYTAADRNSVCEELAIPYQQFDTTGSPKLGFSTGLAKAVLRFVRDHENPVVHIHNSWNFVPFWIWLISCFLDFRIVVSVRGSLFPWSLDQGKVRKKVAWLLFQKRLLKQADAVHVTSDEERAQLEALGISGNLVQIPNGVPIETSHESETAIRIANFAPGEPLRLIFVSRLHAKKGVDILFKALADPRIEFPVELTLAGAFSDDQYRDQIEALDRMLPESVTTKFVGHVDKQRIVELFAQSHLFVLPSHTENFGIAVAEALSYGLPALTTIHTPWHDLKPQNAGYVIDTDKDDLVAALIDFSQRSKEARQEMSQNARALVAAYDWRRLGPSYAEMYDRIAQ